MRYGHFDTGADEYVIDRVNTPSSWINYLGVKDWCTVINQTAGGYSFFRSSQNGRVTRFRPNGIPTDRPGHYVYLRDESDGDYWSASWQPVGKPLSTMPWDEHEPDQAKAQYRTRHGLSYSVFESRYRHLETSQRIFVPVDDDVEIWDVTIRNTGSQARNLTLYGYVEFSFHTITIDNENFQMSLYASGSDYADGVIEYDFYYEPWTYHYFTSTLEPAGFDSRREGFIGEYRTETNPLAVERGECQASQGTTQNHCGALQHRLRVEPGQTVRLAYLLGYGRRAVGTDLRAKYATPGAIDREIERLAQYWREKKDRMAVSTPSEAMNTLLNTWTLFQAETCVVWSRFASFVETGGRTGLGYRDTAQDTMSVSNTNPAKVKQRLEELLQGQMSAGYGLHLFDPLLFEENQREDIPVGVKLPTVVPTSASGQLHGIEDACSDDHLWMVTSVLEYVKETGELDFLSKEIRFADEGSATVYEHLKRAIDFSAEHVGVNGVAEGLRADWNDCLNLGGGETALVSFMHVWAINEFVAAARVLDQIGDAEQYAELGATIAARAERALWDGDWYLRGFTRDGVKIGSKDSPEGKIFLEHMAWSVISGAAPRERALSSMDAVHEHLASPYGTHLNWPSYTEVDDTIGYVTRVYPGVKENGAIFSHPNAWPIIAEAMLGRGERAMEYYDSLAPINQNDSIEVRRSEPYVYSQFIYGRDHEYYGRAENPWLTGTAGWMYQAASKHILGVRPGYDSLIIDPCIPASWPGFSVRRFWRGHVFDIEVRNPGGVNCGVTSCEVDGRMLELGTESLEADRVIARIPLAELAGASASGSPSLVDAGGQRSGSQGSGSVGVHRVVVTLA